MPTPYTIPNKDIVRKQFGKKSGKNIDISNTGSRSNDTLLPPKASTGFSDIEIRSRFSKSNEVTVVRCKTPFTYNGKPVTSYAEVYVMEDKYTYPNYNTCEFYIDEQDQGYHGLSNLEDVSEREGGTREYKLYDTRSGKMVDCNEAFDEMGRVSASMTDYPRMCTFEEFSDRYTVYTNVLNGNTIYDYDDVEKAYKRHVRYCGEYIADGGKLVGDIKTETDFFDATEDHYDSSGNKIGRNPFYRPHTNSLESVRWYKHSNFNSLIEQVIDAEQDKSQNIKAFISYASKRVKSDFDYKLTFESELARLFPKKDDGRVKDLQCVEYDSGDEKQEEAEDEHEFDFARNNDIPKAPRRHHPWEDEEPPIIADPVPKEEGPQIYFTEIEKPESGSPQLMM